MTDSMILKSTISICNWHINQTWWMSTKCLIISKWS